MNRQDAIKYLKRKGKKPTEEEIAKVIKHNKIYGDPVVMILDE